MATLARLSQVFNVHEAATRTARCMLRLSGLYFFTASFSSVRHLLLSTLQTTFVFTAFGHTWSNVRRRRTRPESHAGCTGHFASKRSLELTRGGVKRETVTCRAWGHAQRLPSRGALISCVCQPFCLPALPAASSHGTDVKHFFL